MRSLSIHRLLMAGLLFCFAASSLTAAPGLLSYQGRLLNSQGQPVTSPVNVTFTFWDQVSAGNMLGSFSDSKTVTPNAEGVYATVIGSEPNNPIPQAVFEQEQVYLNVNINGEDLLPRQRITSSAFAINSERVQTFIAAEKITAGDIVMATASGKIKKARDPGVWQPVSTSGLRAERISSTQFMATHTNYPKYYLDIYSFKADGTATVTSTEFTGGEIARIFSLGSGSFVLIYRNSKDYMIAGTVSGTQVTLGNPMQTEGTGGFVIGNGKLMVIKSYSGSTQLNLATVQNNTITINDTKNIMNMHYLSGCKLGAGKSIVFGYDISTMVQNVCIVDHSGATMQLGTLTKASPSTSTGSNCGIYQVDEGKAVLMYPPITCTVVTATGLTPVFGSTSVKIPAASIGIIPPYPYESNKLYNIFDNTISTLNVSGTDISLTPPARMFSLTRHISSGAVIYDAGRLLLHGSTAMGTTSELSIFPLNEVDEIMDDWIGVAEQTVAAGASCRVTVEGGITRKISGLRPGFWYMLTPSGIQQVNPLYLRSNPELRYLILGKALGPDKLLLSYSN